MVAYGILQFGDDLAKTLDIALGKRGQCLHHQQMAQAGGFRDWKGRQGFEGFHLLLAMQTLATPVKNEDKSPRWRNFHAGKQGRCGRTGSPATIDDQPTLFEHGDAYPRAPPALNQFCDVAHPEFQPTVTRHPHSNG